MKYFFSRFKFVKMRDILSFFLLFIVFIPAMIAKIFIRDFWLVCEDRNEARDNGYWIYKYIRENYPKQKVAYAINKKSNDYEKVKKLGKVVSFGGLSHWFWYLVADKNISSQKNGKPNAGVCYLFEVCLGLRKKNRYFLQHGVTMNNVEFLHYKNAKVFKFFTSTEDETNFIKKNFGYSEDAIKLTGLSRFDNLNNELLDKKLILVMPSWRNWIAREIECEKYEGTKVFEETEYYKTWYDFLNNKDIFDFLEKNDMRMIFYPHRNMQKYINSFTTSSKRIEIASKTNYDIQTLLKSACCMITDYSSVCFDFAYMGKPVIFYQFDEEKFRKGQYSSGYFDYKNTPVGYWVNNINDVNKNLKEIQPRFGEPNIELAKKFFKYVDNNNCERIYEVIKNGNKAKN